MIFNTHPELEGKHAFLSPSQYHWIRYDKSKLKSVYLKHLAVERGTKLHELAQKCIEMEVQLMPLGKTLDMYVNHCIEFKMKPEVGLKYSEKCFGRADAISYRRKKLRIFDLKTGSVPAHMEQLMIYAALFCLEYKVKPKDISIELRIYQSDDILMLEPKKEEIESIMESIISGDIVLQETDKEMEK